MKPIVVCGIDLAGSPKRPTGICTMKALTANTRLVYSDEEIIDELPVNALLITIDAPLSLPRGRCCLRNDCDCAGASYFRECDLELRNMSIRFFPITLGPMRMLTERGMRLKAKLEERGFEVMETFPGGAQALRGMPRQKNPHGLRRSLKKFGVKGNISRRGISVHELDAITCTLVARYHVQGKSILIGDPKEGLMVLPKPTKADTKNVNKYEM